MSNITTLLMSELIYDKADRTLSTDYNNHFCGDSAPLILHVYSEKTGNIVSFTLTSAILNLTDNEYILIYKPNYWQEFGGVSYSKLKGLKLHVYA